MAWRLITVACSLSSLAWVPFRLRQDPGYGGRWLSGTSSVSESSNSEFDVCCVGFLAFALRFAEFLTQLASAQAARIDSVDSQTEI